MALAAPPTTTSNPTQTQKVLPNQSLYIQNLPERIQKEDLRRELYMLFSTYAPVIDVTALKTKKMRGQAHVLFRDVNSATLAMRSCRGMEFLGREMRITYSRNRSNTLSKLTGTFHPPASQTTTTAQIQQTSHIAQPPTGFPAPPGSLPAPPSGLPPPPGMLPGPPTSLPPKVNGAALNAPQLEGKDVASPLGVKRGREESEEEDEADGEVEMEVDEDEEMEMSDED